MTGTSKRTLFTAIVGFAILMVISLTIGTGLRCRDANIQALQGRDLMAWKVAREALLAEGGTRYPHIHRTVFIGKPTVADMVRTSAGIMSSYSGCLSLWSVTRGRSSY